MKLIQKKGFLSKEFELTDNSLKIKTKSPAETKQWTVKIENIGDEIIYQSHSKGVVNVFGFICLAVVAIMSYVLIREGGSTADIWKIILLYIVYGGLGTLFLYIPKRKELHLVGGVEITFFPDTPSEQEVNLFIQELIKRSKEILIDKYGKVDIDLPEETQFNQFVWLKNRDIISQLEYERLKQEYKTKRLSMDIS